MVTLAARQIKTRTKVGHDRLSEMDLCEIRPSPENDKLYEPADPNDGSIIALANSIREYGLREPIVVSLDGFILSGHRRYAASKLAGLTAVPVRIEQIRRSDDIDAFVVLLREFNRQRVKSIDVQLREAVIDVNPLEARADLIEYRREKAKVGHDPLSMGECKSRRAISAAKIPFLNAIIDVVNDRREYWPLSDRQIHYALLNDPPLKHAAKPDSTYRNNLVSYKSLVELVTRARIAGDIPFESIGDETRPFVSWNVHREAGTFIRQELDDLFKNYWRDLMQSRRCVISNAI